MRVADRMRANAAMLQMLHRRGRGVTMKHLPGLVADLLRDAAEIDRMVEAEVFMASQMPTKQGRKAA